MTDELIPVCKLSKRQKEVLQLLADGEEIVFEKGAGWWIGNDRINGKLPIKLLRHLALKESEYGGIIQRYTINETGLKSLSTGYLYTHPKLFM